MTDFTSLVDLADRRLGAGVVAANDEFFAPKESLLDRAAPAFDPLAFTARGKLMDGWETRRRREPGHDWAIVRLGAPGVVRGVVVDTAYFLGNYPQSCSVEAVAAEGYPGPAELAEAAWAEIVPRSQLEGGAEHQFAVSDEHRWTHVRLSIYPDGGVARFRVYGDVLADPRLVAAGSLDLAAVENGGMVLDCSNRFFSAPANLLLPGSPATMADGWETERRRTAGNDWVLLRLAARGAVRQVLVDTTHFKGNAPATCRITGCDAAASAVDSAAAWTDILPPTALQPDTVHRFEAAATGPITHARLEIYPDGGLARLRLFGELDPAGSEVLGLAWLNALPPQQAQQVLLGCNAAPVWAAAVVARRPFANAAALFTAAHEAADALGRDGWLAAFAAHPRIGERSGLSARSAQEQAGAAGASAQESAALVEANHRYEQRFGHVFLICASGLLAEHMLGALRERLGNDADAEFAVAIAEHRKITALRLRGLLGQPR